MKKRLPSCIGSDGPDADRRRADDELRERLLVHRPVTMRATATVRKIHQNMSTPASIWLPVEVPSR